jgi:hypothetical protein
MPAPDAANRPTAVTDEPEPALTASIVDVMSEDSFPASDPPAVWTWDTSDRSRPADDRSRPADSDPADAGEGG